MRGYTSTENLGGERGFPCIRMRGSLSQPFQGSAQLSPTFYVPQISWGSCPDSATAGLHRVVGLDGRLGFNICRLLTSLLLLLQAHRGDVANFWGLQVKALGLENPSMLCEEEQSYSRGELCLYQKRKISAF